MRMETMGDLKLHYPSIFQLANNNLLLQRDREYSNLRNSLIGSIDAFNWARSPEGHSFWSHVCHNNIERAQRDYPEYFQRDVYNLEGYKIKKNGLWQV